MASNLPLTVVPGVLPSGAALVAIGSSGVMQQLTPGYWILVVDRTTLAVVYNQVQTANDQVPPISQYNDSNHILILATMAVNCSDQPQGAFYQFLDLNGGSVALNQIAQVAQQFGCGYFGYFGYALVSVLGNENTPGFELVTFDNAIGSGQPLTLQLMPVQVGNQTLWTPIALGP